MTRRSGIVLAIGLIVAVIGLDWASGAAPDPYRAPDPIAWGSASGASGAICSFAPPTSTQ